MTLSSLYCCTSSLIGCVWFAQTPGRWRWRQRRWRRTARLVRPLQPQDTVVSADADGSVTRTRPARCRCSGGSGNGTAGGGLWRLSRSVRRRAENKTAGLCSPTHTHISCPPVTAHCLMTSVSIRNKSDYFVLHKQWVLCK